MAGNVSNYTSLSHRMFPDCDSFTGYQSSPIRHNTDSISGFEVMNIAESPRGTPDFPLFKIDAPTPWEVDEISIPSVIYDPERDVQYLDQKPQPDRPQSSQRGTRKTKIPRRKKIDRAVFHPFESAESTELTVKLLRLWIDKRCTIEQVAGMDMLCTYVMDA